ncbi:hypothetical protein C0993_002752 [Termitomyces sp. T159_Od127]|nr:hypothetical protein C0993_002752 [Termitomyces sp. T159_Od127]
MACILCYICLPFLFFLPRHFASQAGQFIKDAQATDGSLHVRGDGNETRTVEDRRTNSAPQDIVLSSVARPADVHFESSPFHAWNGIPSLITRPEDSIYKQMGSSWNAYVEYCCEIWTRLASVAGTILLLVIVPLIITNKLMAHLLMARAFAPILNMPGTEGDPLVRGFMYLSIFRVLTSFLLALILLLYFRKDSRSRSTDFAMAWYKV